MKQYLNKRVLLTIGDNDAPIQTCVLMISPNGLYVNLDGDQADDNYTGWVKCSLCKVLDVIGPENEKKSDRLKRLSQ